MVYIYYLYDPVNKVPFYVGATKSPKTRLMAHIYDTSQVLWMDLRYRYKRIQLIKERKKQGIKIEMVIIEEVPKEIAREKEKFHHDRLVAEGHELYNQPGTFNYVYEHRK